MILFIKITLTQKIVYLRKKYQLKSLNLKLYDRLGCFKETLSMACNYPTKRNRTYKWTTSSKLYNSIIHKRNYERNVFALTQVS